MSALEARTASSPKGSAVHMWIVFDDAHEREIISLARELGTDYSEPKFQCEGKRGMSLLPAVEQRNSEFIRELISRNIPHQTECVVSGYGENSEFHTVRLHHGTVVLDHTRCFCEADGQICAYASLHARYGFPEPSWWGSGSNSKPIPLPPLRKAAAEQTVPLTVIDLINGIGSFKDHRAESVDELREKVNDLALAIYDACGYDQDQDPPSELVFEWIAALYAFWCAESAQANAKGAGR